MSLNSVYKIFSLPKPEWEAYWKRIYTNKGIKQSLLNYAHFNRNINGCQVAKEVLDIHGIVFLYGPPGNGKTSLARGFSNRVAKDILKKGCWESVKFIRWDHHLLGQKFLGDTPKLTEKVFHIVKETAEGGTFVCCLLDEIESLLMARQSLDEADPTDVFKTVNLVLTELDNFVDLPNVLFIGTSNISQALDPAFMDRIDYGLFIDYPNAHTRSAILKDSFRELNEKVGTDLKLKGDLFEELVHHTSGMSGRQIRKLVIHAYTNNSHAARNLRQVKMEDFLHSISKLKGRGDFYAQNPGED